MIGLNVTIYRRSRALSTRWCAAYLAACLGMGVALLELQVLALEIAASFVAVKMNSGPIGAPTSSVTLMPPDIRLGLRIREPAEMLVAAE